MGPWGLLTIWSTLAHLGTTARSRRGLQDRRGAARPTSGLAPTTGWNPGWDSVVHRKLPLKVKPSLGNLARDTSVKNPIVADPSFTTQHLF